MKEPVEITRVVQNATAVSVPLSSGNAKISKVYEISIRPRFTINQDADKKPAHITFSGRKVKLSLCLIN
jgi:hypothetical protein